MRKILLASAALTLCAGMAVAQTSTAAPAPEGAVNAPVQTAPGLSPGKSAPPAGGASQTMSPNGMGMSGGPGATKAPAPEGATNAPVETAPGMSPGKSAPPPPQ